MTPVWPAPAVRLTYDLAADVSGSGHPSLAAAAISPPLPRALLSLPGTPSGAAGTSGAFWWWWGTLLTVGVVLVALGVRSVAVRRRARIANG